ncbi:uncharacterized protein SPPG_07409 [Spizellomyces punctatus DAOM BR117]|uniref:VHS domain-containing protein n=1 Tax=Spizellomyces punctatus (strain DAOM BR117) TaxID=645134 RepID=A0A0L0H974_SPIPD|nr:uncharacterized protein SPPG_07409 [Spizellomyces punctatus DAOM BR117]KNC97494.1 hypothetical protein SPPG_07409 [Spizellomyces punctatus DAOM BR117]|eukprot:XP_016605534.1 hypothetical protein SPPG_07409 [Spizellomyces punctatus DAOM BR117]
MDNCKLRNSVSRALSSCPEYPSTSTTLTKLQERNMSLKIFKKGGGLADLIEEASAPELEEVNWTMVFAAADRVNMQADGGKEVVRALKRRLKHKSPVVQSYALTILDALMKNCGAKVQVAFVHPENVASLMRLYDSNDFVQENRMRFVNLVAEWMESTRDPGVRPPLIGLLSWLGGKGYFPSPVVGARHGSQGGLFMTISSGRTQSPQILIPSLASHRGWLSSPPTESFAQRSEQMAKDLILADNNIAMFMEALNFLPPEESPSENELVQEFRAKCKEIQSRVLRLIQEIDDGDLLGKLVKINGDIDAAFTLYDETVESRNLLQALENSQHNVRAREKAAGGIVFREPAREVPDLISFSGEGDPFSDRFQTASGSADRLNNPSPQDASGSYIPYEVPSAKKLGKLPASVNA